MHSQRKSIVIARSVLITLIVLAGAGWWFSALEAKDNVLYLANYLGAASALALLFGFLARWDKQARLVRQNELLTEEARERDRLRVERHRQRGGGTLHRSWQWWERVRASTRPSGGR